MRTALVFVAAAGLALGMTSPVRAATVSVTVSQVPAERGNVDTHAEVRYVAAPGEDNALELRAEERTLWLRDGGAQIAAGAGCESVGPETARCPLPPALPFLEARLGDAEDRLHVDLPQPWIVTAWGGDGNDQLSGHAIGLYGDAGDDRLTGSPRWDHLHGGDGADVLLGGDGDDDLDGGPGDDVLDAGPGRDFLRYPRAAPVHVDLAAGVGGEAGERDLLSGFEVVYGGAGADVLRGGPDADLLSGQLGDDRIEGRDGDDSLEGDGGADTLLGEAGDDFVSGGPGVDALDGGEGDDALAPWTGRDRLACGTGADQIRISGRRSAYPLLPADCERLITDMVRLYGWTFEGRRLRVDVGVGFDFQYGGRCAGLTLSTGVDTAQVRRVGRGELRSVRLRVPARGAVRLRIAPRAPCAGNRRAYVLRLARR